MFIHFQYIYISSPEDNPDFPSYILLTNNQNNSLYTSLVSGAVAVQVLQADHWTAGFKSGYSCACDLCLGLAVSGFSIGSWYFDCGERHVGRMASPKLIWGRNIGAQLTLD